MTLDQIPLFAMLKGKLGYLNERQRLIAQNVANADTPGFRPTDLAPFEIPSELTRNQTARAAAAMSPMRTNVKHMSQTAAARPASVYKSKPAESDSEVLLDGNGVVLEEQMMKMTEARIDYDAAIGFYQKSVGLLRMAARKPGG